MVTTCPAGSSVARTGWSLTDFVHAVFRSLPRVDQQRWADVYMRGLLSTPGRKTMKRLAGQICGEPSAGQALQQFITSSPWDWRQPRTALAGLATRHLRDHVWVAGTFVSEKKGSRSAGVHRRFVPAFGTTVNCQVGVGLFLVSATEAIPVDWSLVLDGEWCEDAALRRQARIPDSVTGGTAWERALDMAAGACSTPRAERAPLVADLTVTGDDLADVTAVPASGPREFLVRVRPDHPVVEHGRATGQSLSTALSTVEHVVAVSGVRSRLTLSHHDDGSGPVRVRSTPVRLPGRREAARGGTSRPHRLFVLDSPDGTEEAQYWLSTLRVRNVGHVLSLVRRQQLVTATLRTLAGSYGLMDFEGRSYPGWHHHMTMVSAAYAYRRLVSEPADCRSA
jgi:hypothetical protein